MTVILSLVSDSPAPVGKGRATPSRREREAARKRPIVATDRKAARAANRGRLAEERERARLGYAAGDERYLQPRDKGPQRRYVRDFIDARTSFGEFLMPIVVIMLIGSFIEAIASYVLLAVWAYFLLVVIDSVVIGFQIKRRLTAKFGQMDRGSRWYGVMRALQLRQLRLPKPQVKRGAHPAR